METVLIARILVKYIDGIKVKPGIPTVNFEGIGLFTPGHIIAHSRQKWTPVLTLSRWTPD